MRRLVVGDVLQIGRRRVEPFGKAGAVGARRAVTIDTAMLGKFVRTFLHHLGIVEFERRLADGVEMPIHRCFAHLSNSPGHRANILAARGDVVVATEQVGARCDCNGDRKHPDCRQDTHEFPPGWRERLSSRRALNFVLVPRPSSSVLPSIIATRDGHAKSRSWQVCPSPALNLVPPKRGARKPYFPNTSHSAITARR